MEVGEIVVGLSFSDAKMKLGTREPLQLEVEKEFEWTWIWDDDYWSRSEAALTVYR